MARAWHLLVRARLGRPTGVDQSGRSTGARIRFATPKGFHGDSASREIVASFLDLLDETTPPPQARARPAALAFPARWRGGGLRG